MLDNNAVKHVSHGGSVLRSIPVPVSVTRTITVLSSLRVVNRINPHCVLDGAWETIDELIGPPASPGHTGSAAYARMGFHVTDDSA